MAHTNVKQPPATFTGVNTIAERLKEAREERGLNQIQLAEAAGVSPGTIGNLESGLRKNPRELLAIAAAVRVRPEWLKTGRGPKHESSPGEPSPRQNVGVAHLQTLPASTVPPFTWEDLKMPLSTVFRVVLPDDALAPDLRAGDWIEFSTEIEARPGDVVLVEDSAGLFYARVFRQRRPGDWSAAAVNPAFEPLEAEKYGLRIVATLIGEGRSRRWSDR